MCAAVVESSGGVALLDFVLKPDPGTLRAEARGAADEDAVGRVDSSRSRSLARPSTLGTFTLSSFAVIVSASFLFTDPSAVFAFFT